MKKEQEEQELFLKNNEVYVDANFFIYASTDLEKEGENARKIIDLIKKQEISVFTATLTIDEVLWAIQRKKDKETAYQSAQLILEMPQLKFIPVDIEIIRSSINIYKKENLHPRDAIHLAAMQSKNIKVIISSDPDFDKIKDIKRIDFGK